MEDNIKVYLKEAVCVTVWAGFSWLRIGSKWRAFVSTVMSLRVPQIKQDMF